VEAIRSYSLTADKSLLSAVFEKECACREEWEFVLDHERPWSLPLTR
jgi:hypothetical protein